MTISNPEAGGGGGEPEPVLRQEARKALSGRVPLALSIALALLSGVLVGYGVRAFTSAHGCERRERHCPRAGPVVMPRASEASDCKPRLLLLQEPAPVPAAAEPAAGSAGLDAPAAAAAERPEARSPRADRLSKDYRTAVTRAGSIVPFRSPGPR